MVPVFRHLVIAAVMLTGAAGASVRAQLPQSPVEHVAETFRSTVDVVTIQASVRDGRGRSLQGLTTSDFEVRDNGQVRPLLSFGSDGQAPVSLAILVDMSGSMRIGSKIAMARRAFDAVLSGLRERDDEAAVFTFDSALHERRGFTGEVATLQDA
jgi:Ca-activated chloride channel family protein